MKEIDEKDLENASGGSWLSGKCEKYEPKNASAAALPSNMQTCSTCSHFNAHPDNGKYCDLGLN